MPPVLETKRLRLRPPVTSDLDNIFRLGNNPRVMRFITKGKTQSRSEAMADLKKRMRWRDEKLGYWITEEKDSREFIGWMALKKLDKTNAVEIGYRFLEEHWSRGFATEGGQAIIDYAFSELDLTEVVAVAIEENRASTRVMEKLGMSYLGKGKFYNTECVYYQIKKETWLANLRS